jgi:hypothetical protein
MAPGARGDHRLGSVQRDQAVPDAINNATLHPAGLKSALQSNVDSPIRSRKGMKRTLWVSCSFIGWKPKGGRGGVGSERGELQPICEESPN